MFKLAKLGDAIETTVRQPCGETIRMVLATAASCAAGNQLLLKENSGWRLVDRSEQKPVAALHVKDEHR